jgi:CDP-diacylglycerol--glycerol-3-phosphate 3-phosphatidyltransferase
MYRLVSAPFLLILAVAGELQVFKWLMAFSFLTDAIDGPLSRRFKVTSVFGSRLDSVADDATVLVSTIALFVVEPEFFKEHWLSLASLFVLFGIQTIATLVAYGKVTSFHTYLAKIAAVAQAFVFISVFFRLPGVEFTFYSAVIITGIQLLEEIALVIILPEWKSNVKGLYWILQLEKKRFSQQ